MNDKKWLMILCWFLGIVVMIFMIQTESARIDYQDRIEKLEKQVAELNEQVLEPAVGVIE